MLMVLKNIEKKNTFFTALFTQENMVDVEESSSFTTICFI